MAKTHRVQHGECLASIGLRYGFVPETLWDHDLNAGLRDERESPNVLMAGDVVHIPDLRQRVETGATDQLHRFRRKAVPARFRLQLLNGSEPRAGLSFVLSIDDAIEETGQTDGKGVLDVPLPPDARRGHLTVTDEEGHESVYELSFGHLAPASEEEGVRQRLYNLGFLRSREADEHDLGAAMRLFQAAFDLKVTGEADAASQEKLAEIHDQRTDG